MPLTFRHPLTDEENSLLESLNPDRIPEHVGVIMDGNGRWAKARGKNRLFGHQEGVRRVRPVMEAAHRAGVKYLTLYTFSTENWSRPKAEVSGIMAIFSKTLQKEIDELETSNVRLNFIGDVEGLPPKARQMVEYGMKRTEICNGSTLTIALNYGARQEIKQAMRRAANDAREGKLAPESIDERLISSYLYTHDMPDPDLIVRTSGEVRISNFLLWQAAYAEFYFTETLWPDFGALEFFKALHDYQSRERRFGGT